MDALFPETYEMSRERFLQDSQQIRSLWPSARSGSHPLRDFPDLSIDWLWLEPSDRENLLIVSTGQHGIEGYVGSAMLKIFMDEFIPRINPADTGLLLVHAINPWGMKNRRKVNENGVDLNRNFIFEGPFDPSVNPEFSKLKYFLAPPVPLGSFAGESLKFAGRAIQVLIGEGAATLTRAALLGQYVDPKAMYYGGDHHEEETRVMMNFFQEGLDEYQKVIHLDLHSGYGPRDQMSITLVPLEPLTSAELSAKFKYPLVQRGDSQEFYATYGDMTAYLYELRNRHFPGKHVFATVLEFGTFGDSLPARLRSLRAMIFESQLHAHGAKAVRDSRKVQREFQELYFPREQKWQEKALLDCRQAFEGIISASGMFARE